MSIPPFTGPTARQKEGHHSRRRVHPWVLWRGHLPRGCLGGHRRKAGRHRGSSSPAAGGGGGGGDAIVPHLSRGLARGQGADVLGGPVRGWRVPRAVDCGRSDGQPWIWGRMLHPALASEALPAGLRPMCE